jgi:DNA-binding response OmpR family regulator
LLVRVLVIEGGPAIAALPADLLAGAGHAADGAATMADGPARARAGPYDACVTDRFWPEVVAETRADLADLGSCCPVVLLSGRDRARCARPADPGVAAVVPKPFDLDDPLDALATVTSWPPACCAWPRPTRPGA